MQLFQIKQVEAELAQEEYDARPHLILEEGPGEEEEGVAGQYGDAR